MNTTGLLLILVMERHTVMFLISEIQAVEAFKDITYIKLELSAHSKVYRNEILPSHIPPPYPSNGFPSRDTKRDQLSSCRL